MAVITRSMSMKARASTAPTPSTTPTRHENVVHPTEPTRETASVDMVAVAQLASVFILCPWIATTPSGDVMDASLVMVDLAHNTDKFVILQLIEAIPRLPGATTFFVFTRSGQTGTVGQHQLDGPFTTMAETQVLFESKFHDKTGQNWTDRASFSQIDGLYDLLRIDYDADPCAAWSYYMDHLVDGNPRGWCIPTVKSENEAEQLWQTYLVNSAYNRRIVQFGHNSYCIDLDAMTQTNLRTSKTRPERRVWDN